MTSLTAPLFLSSHSVSASFMQSCIDFFRTTLVHFNLKWVSSSNRSVVRLLRSSSSPAGTVIASAISTPFGFIARRYIGTAIASMQWHFARDIATNGRTALFTDKSADRRTGPKGPCPSVRMSGAFCHDINLLNTVFQPMNSRAYAWGLTGLYQWPTFH